MVANHPKLLSRDVFPLKNSKFIMLIKYLKFKNSCHAPVQIINLSAPPSLECTFDFWEMGVKKIKSFMSVFFRSWGLDLLFVECNCLWWLLTKKKKEEEEEKKRLKTFENSRNDMKICYRSPCDKQVIGALVINKQLCFQYFIKISNFSG